MSHSHRFNPIGVSRRLSIPPHTSFLYLSASLASFGILIALVPPDDETSVEPPPWRIMPGTLGKQKPCVSFDPESVLRNFDRSIGNFNSKSNSNSVGLLTSRRLISISITFLHSLMYVLLLMAFGVSEDDGIIL